METIFQLLGKILDDLSQGSNVFNVDCENGTAVFEASDTDIIDACILPLFEDEKIHERCKMIEHCKYYYAVIKISQNKIIEVGLGDDLDNYISCDVSTKILKYLADLGFSFDETYTMICAEITKKCEFIVDNANMM